MITYQHWSTIFSSVVQFIQLGLMIFAHKSIFISYIKKSYDVCFTGVGYISQSKFSLYLNCK